MLVQALIEHRLSPQHRAGHVPIVHLLDSVWIFAHEMLAKGALLQFLSHGGNECPMPGPGRVWVFVSVLVGLESIEERLEMLGGWIADVDLLIFIGCRSIERSLLGRNIDLLKA